MKKQNVGIASIFYNFSVLIIWFSEFQDENMTKISLYNIKLSGNNELWSNFSKHLIRKN